MQICSLPIVTQMFVSVCVFGTGKNCAKTAEPIEMLFGGRLLWAQVIVLDVGQDRTSTRAAARGDKTAMRPLATLLWTLVQGYCPRSQRQFKARKARALLNDDWDWQRLILKCDWLADTVIQLESSWQRTYVCHSFVTANLDLNLNPF